MNGFKSSRVMRRTLFQNTGGWEGCGSSSQFSDWYEFGRSSSTGTSITSSTRGSLRSRYCRSNELTASSPRSLTGRTHPPGRPSDKSSLPAIQRSFVCESWQGSYDALDSGGGLHGPAPANGIETAILLMTALDRQSQHGPRIRKTRTIPIQVAVPNRLSQLGLCQSVILEERRIHSEVDYGGLGCSSQADTLFQRGYHCGPA